MTSGVVAFRPQVVAVVGRAMVVLINDLLDRISMAASLASNSRGDSREDSFASNDRRSTRTRTQASGGQEVSPHTVEQVTSRSTSLATGESKRHSHLTHGHSSRTLVKLSAATATSAAAVATVATAKLLNRRRRRCRALAYELISFFFSLSIAIATSLLARRVAPAATAFATDKRRRV